jgi:hypothetical protein
MGLVVGYRACALLFAATLATTSTAGAAPYRYEETIKTLDAPAARRELESIPGPGISKASMGADKLAIRITGALVNGPDEGDLKSSDVRKTDRYFAFDFDVDQAGPPLPCGMPRGPKVSAHFMKRDGRWWPDSSLGWFLKTGRCPP